MITPLSFFGGRQRFQAQRAGFFMKSAGNSWDSTLQQGTVFRLGGFSDPFHHEISRISSNTHQQLQGSAVEDDRTVISIFEVSCSNSIAVENGSFI